jgi:hypothetical protein
MIQIAFCTDSLFDLNEKIESDNVNLKTIKKLVAKIKQSLIEQSRETLSGMFCDHGNLFV